MTQTELSLLDTNLLVYAIDARSSYHRDSKNLLDRAIFADAGLCIVPQILSEFYAVVTNPRRVQSPITPEDALQAIETFLARPGLWVLPIPVDLVTRWVQLCRQHVITGSRVFDMQIAAAMLANGVRKVYTFDRRFASIPGIIIEDPEVQGE